MGEYLALMGPAVANHLWQSSAFAVVAAGLALALRRNHARARYWVWMVASLKFVVPFALLAGMVGHFAKPRAAAAVAQPSVYVAVEDVSEPFVGTVVDVSVAIPHVSEARHGAPEFAAVLPVAAVAVWLLGCVTVLVAWWAKWRRVARVVRAGAAMGAGREVDALRRIEAATGCRRRIELRVCEGAMEPGVFGIARPMLAWPAGISARLDDAQMEAVLAHEVCHVRRRDNLTAAMHMIVEAAFWFHPLAWWVGARLVEERERACDEAVMALCGRPEAYAQSILKVCEFCVESPLECVAGVTGADLKQRVMEIMTRRVAHRLSLGKKVLLVAAAVCAAAVPVVLGQAQAARRMMLAAVEAAPKPVRAWAAAHAMIAEEQTPYEGLIAEVQAEGQAPMGTAMGAAYVPTLTFDVASIRETHPVGGHVVGGQTLLHSTRVDLENVSLMQLVRMAYELAPFQIVGGPSWYNTATFDVHAGGDAATEEKLEKLTDAQAKLEKLHMFQALLAERFHLKMHMEFKEGPIYELTVARAGVKFHAARPADTSDAAAKPGFSAEADAGGSVENANGVEMAGLADLLTLMLRCPVQDKTGLAGRYDFALHYFMGKNGQPSENPTKSPPLEEAIQEQLGLKLVPAKGPVQTLVIDEVEKPSVDGAEVQAPDDQKQTLHGVYKTWLEQDVRWIISDQEAEAFNRLTNDEKRDRFIEQFWQRRNPTPDGTGNAYRDEIYARIAYANENFASGQPGWMTDRGHIYIAYGKPDEIDVQPADGTQIWRYRYLPGVGDNVVLKFGDGERKGDYRLMTPMPQAGAGAQGPNPLKRRLTDAERMTSAAMVDSPRQSLNGPSGPGSPAGVVVLPGSGGQGGVVVSAGPGAAAEARVVTPEEAAIAESIQFDVAVFRVNKTNRPGALFEMRPDGDGLVMMNRPMRDLIRFAYNVSSGVNFHFANEPAWINDVKWDIRAKVAPEDLAKWQKLSNAARTLTLRRFCVEQLKLQFHPDMTPYTYYNLVVDKKGAKMAEAKPGDNTSLPYLRMAPESSVSWLGPGTVVGHAGTMTQLAVVLSGHTPWVVHDETGLTGKYNFMMSYAPGSIDDPRARALGVPPTSVSADDDRPALFTAVEQLGLKMVATKGPLEGIVIDHVEMPPDN